MNAMQRLKAKVAAIDPVAAKLQRLCSVTGRGYGRQVKGGKFQIVIDTPDAVIAVSDWMPGSAVEAAVDRLLAEHA